MLTPPLQTSASLLHAAALGGWSVARNTDDAKAILRAILLRRALVQNLMAPHVRKSALFDVVKWLASLRMGIQNLVDAEGGGCAKIVTAAWGRDE